MKYIANLSNEIMSRINMQLREMNQWNRLSISICGESNIFRAPRNENVKDLSLNCTNKISLSLSVCTILPSKLSNVWLWRDSAAFTTRIQCRTLKHFFQCLGKICAGRKENNRINCCA